MQIVWLAPRHDPDRHRSPPVHALWSSQAVPSGFGGLQRPVAASHTPSWWHWSGAGPQTTGFPVQVPFWQVSEVVHAAPSLHAVPFGFGGNEHRPVWVLQVPPSWHWSGGKQRV